MNLIKQRLREELSKIGVFYRAMEKYMGNDILFEPNGYYEGIDKNNGPIYKYDTFWVSNTPETAASKYVGGAVLGLTSMFRYHHKLEVNKPIFIYAISEQPDKDISDWGLHDFEYLEEVRYRRPVSGKYIGKVMLTQELIDLFNIFYEVIGRTPNEFADDDDNDDEKDAIQYEKEIKLVDMLEDGSFTKILKSIKPKK